MNLSRKTSWLSLWCMLLCVSAFAQGPVLTTVAYTYARPDGSLPSGTISIMNPPFTSPDGFPIAAANKTAQFFTGAISVQLVPTQGGSPDRQLYTVLITPQGNPMVQEFWSVPQSAGAVNHAAVISYQTPLPNPLIGIPEGGTGASTAAQARANLGITSGSVTGFSAGNLLPLFNSSVATPSSTPALSFSLLTTEPDSIFGNFSGATARPAYGGGLISCGDSTHALGYLNHVFECQSLSSGTPLPANTDPLAADSFGAAIASKTIVNVMNYGAKCDATTDDSPAFTAAVAAMPGGTPYPALNTVGGGILLIPASPTPCNLVSARLAITKANVKVSGYGASLLCTVADDCVTLGDLTNVNSGINNITIEGLAIEPGVGSVGHSAIRDNAQGTRIVDVSDVYNYTGWPAHYGFNHFIENDDDFFQQVEHLYISGGTLRCDPTFCGSYIWGPGPFATNAGITYLSGGFNISPECSGNGIDWNNNNTLSIRDGVIEGYNQFAIRAWASNNPSALSVNHVYMERGSCTNPFGNVGSAGVITYSPTTWVGSQLGGGSVPVFTHSGSGSGTNYQYYIVGKNAGGAVTVPMSAGYITNALVGASDSITTNWIHYGATSYTMLRQEGYGVITAAPYGTGNWAVAVDLAASSACNAAGLCTFVDTVASPSSYTVSTSPTYSPTITFWGGAIVLAGSGATYSGSPLSLGGIFVSPNAPNAGQINLTAGPTTAYYQDPEPFSPVRINVPPGSGVLYQPQNAILMDQGYGAVLGSKKGLINLGQASRAYTVDTITLGDSNPNKTSASISGRPASDVGDAAVCVDHAGTCFRDPIALTEYINSLGNNVSWLERLTASLKIFNVPLTAFSVAQLVAPFCGYLADIPTGGMLLPGHQYCYIATTLDYLGESYHDRPEGCITTANDGNSTHQVQAYFKSNEGATRGYNVYGRETGTEQLMTPSHIANTWPDYYFIFTDTGSVTPSGAMPTKDTTGQISATQFNGRVAHGISFTMGDPVNNTALTTSEVQYVTVPFACTIQAYNLAIDAGTITVKFWKVASGTAIPTASNSINTAGVSIAGGTAIHSGTLTDFTTTDVVTNDIMAMAVTAVATAKFVNGVLQCQ